MDAWTRLTPETQLLVCSIIIGPVMAAIQGIATRTERFRWLTTETANIRKQLLALALIAIPAIAAGRWSAETTAAIITSIAAAFGSNQGSVMLAKLISSAVGPPPPKKRRRKA